jgi:transposase
MAAIAACPVTVTGAVRRILISRARGQKTPYRDKVRAQIVLLAARRQTNARIATQVGVTVDTGRTWCGRFAAQGLAGLVDRARSGRPPRFRPVQVAQVKALACQLPRDAGAPLARWSCPELAREAVTRAWPSRSRRPRCVGGWLGRRSSLGSTDPGCLSVTRISR